MISLYVVTNKVNGKQYVGMTEKTLSKRRSAHRAAMQAGSHYKFHNALRKHGLDNFDWEVVACAETRESGAAAEIDLIKQMRPEYNLTAGGEGVSMKREGEALRVCQETIKRAGEIRRQNPNWREENRKTTAESWQRHEVREARVAGMRAAIPSVDMAARGAKISATKSQPENVEKTRAQAKARVAADGGVQIRSAQSARWAKPGAREAWSEKMKQRYADPAWRAKSAEYAQRRCGKAG